MRNLLSPLIVFYCLCAATSWIVEARGSSQPDFGQTLNVHWKDSRQAKDGYEGFGIRKIKESMLKNHRENPVYVRCYKGQQAKNVLINLHDINNHLISLKKKEIISPLLPLMEANVMTTLMAKNGFECIMHTLYYNAFGYTMSDYIKKLITGLPDITNDHRVDHSTHIKSRAMLLAPIVKQLIYKIAHWHRRGISFPTITSDNILITTNHLSPPIITIIGLEKAQIISIPGFHPKTNPFPFLPFFLEEASSFNNRCAFDSYDIGTFILEWMEILKIEKRKDHFDYNQLTVLPSHGPLLVLKEIVKRMMDAKTVSDWLPKELVEQARLNGGPLIEL